MKMNKKELVEVIKKRISSKEYIHGGGGSSSDASWLEVTNPEKLAEFLLEEGIIKYDSQN